MSNGKVNDYRLLYLYFLADREGKLDVKHKSEFERLTGIYSISEVKQDTKDCLKELRYIEYKGILRNGEWELTEEEMDNPVIITKTGLCAIEKKIFQSETAFRNLQDDILVHQKNEFEYKERIRAQEDIIRCWKLTAAIAGIIGAFGWIVIAIFAYFGYNF